MNIRLGAAAVLASALVVTTLGSPSASARDLPTAAASARAGHSQHYHELARRVSREIDCVDYFALGALTGYYDGGKCTIRHERVGIITFKSAAQQRRFLRNVDFGPRRYWWASGHGAIILPDGRSEKAAAQAAARRLPGALKRG